MTSKYPFLGFGLGLRPDHYSSVLETLPKIDWFEIITENYLVPGGKPLHFLHSIRQHYPMVMHGVSLSIGSTDAINTDYLRRVKTLAQSIEATWISDHLCWTGVNNTNTHDLMPLPYTKEALSHVVDRVSAVQEFLGQRILLENVSSYVTYSNSEMSEWDFLTEVSRRSDCLLLLDINNIYVSAFNHGFDPLDYLTSVPVDRVQQFHLAGHSNNGTHIVDTHDDAIVDPVWELFAKAVSRFGDVSTMIERDANIPPLEDLILELDRARSIYNVARDIAA